MQSFCSSRSMQHDAVRGSIPHLSSCGSLHNVGIVKTFTTHTGLLSKTDLGPSQTY